MTTESIYPESMTLEELAMLCGAYLFGKAGATYFEPLTGPPSWQGVVRVADGLLGKVRVTTVERDTYRKALALAFLNGRAVGSGDITLPRTTPGPDASVSEVAAGIKSVVAEMMTSDCDWIEQVLESAGEAGIHETLPLPKIDDEEAFFKEVDRRVKPRTIQRALAIRPDIMRLLFDPRSW